tara:strand:+ start:10 stop:2511 length:2502 start_codon:yes stop_codon:yes gene_type:complete
MATNTEKIVVQVVVQGDKQLGKLEKKTKSTTLGFGKMAASILSATVAFQKINQILSSSIKSFRDFEFQMAKVRAITNSNDTQFKMLTKSAQQLGRTTFFTATEVAKLQTNYGKLGFTTGEILKAQEATLALATATDTDLARAAIVAGAAIRGFGLDASETKRVTDVMAVSFTSSAMDIEKFQTSMTKVAPIAAAAGISIEATTAVMSKLTDTGIEASIAGTSLRNIFLKMQDSSSDLSKFLGFTVNSSDDLQKALNKLNEAGLSNEEVMGLVDIRQVAAFNTMIRGADNIAALTEKFNEANGALDRMVDIIEDNLEGDFKKLTSAVDGLRQELGEELSPTLRNFLQQLTKLTNSATDNSDAIFEITVKIASFFNTVGKGINSFISPFKNLKKSIFELTNSDSWRQVTDFLGLSTARDQAKIDASLEQERLNEQLQETLDLTNSNIKQTQKNIETVKFNIRIREKELELRKEKFKNLPDTIKDPEQERLENELKLLKENLKIRQDVLFEQKEIQKEANALAEESAAKILANTDAEKQNLNTKQQSTLEQEIQNQALRDYLDIMGLVLDKTMSVKEAEEALRLEKIKDIEDTLANAPLIMTDYQTRLKLEKQLIDLKLQGLTDEEAKRKEQIGQMQQVGQQLITLAGQDEKYQKVRELGVRISAAAALANNAESLSLQMKGLSKDISAGFPTNLIAVASTLALLLSMKQNFQVLARGEQFANGGMVQGRSHAQGGEKFAVGGRVVELEGGEAVINKRSTAMFRNQLSAMNAAGGGVKFADGGLLNMPSFTQQQFNALGQTQMMGAMQGGRKVVVVEADITNAQDKVSVIESQATL